jgi:hypothetical protein
MLLTSGASRIELEVVEDAVAEVAATVDRQGPDEFAGEWTCMRGTHGVILRVTEPDDFQQVVRALASALERRGVDGSLGPYHNPRVPELPDAARLLECRLRVRGERLHRAKGNFGWLADRPALVATIERAVDWCIADGRRGELALAVGLLPEISLLPQADIVGRIVETLDSLELAKLRTLAGDEVRCVAVDPFGGRVTLIETVPPGEWSSPCAGLIGFLREAGDSAVYGFIKHGSMLSQAMLGMSLTYDWPARPGIKPTAISLAQSAAFEDEYAPDAFAAQLLGPRYAGRVPDSAPWSREPVGGDALLLLHAQPEAWFDTLFVPFDPGYRGARGVSPPNILVESREELAPIIFCPDKHLPEEPSAEE